MNILSWIRSSLAKPHLSLQAPPSAWTRLDLGILLVCLLLALSIRSKSADHGLSFDETWILAGANGFGSDCLDIPSDVLIHSEVSPTALENARSAQSVFVNRVPFHPPLHSLTLWCWRNVFGESPWVASMYSVFWSVLAIGFVFAAVRLQFGTTPATCVALVLALSPVQIQLGTEVRGYGMLTGLMAIAIWQMIRIERFGPTIQRIWWLGLSLTPLPLIHYLAATPCVAIGLWGLWSLKGNFRWHWLAATSCAAAVILGSTLPFISSDIKLTQTIDLYFVKNNTIIDKCITSLALTIKLLFFVSPSHRLYWSILLIVNALLMIVGLWRNRSLGIWIALLMTPIATMLLVDVLRETNQSAMTRYAAAASACAASGPILASFAIHRWLGLGQTLLLLTLSLLELDSPRDIGSPQFHAMSTKFSPIIASLPKETPVVSASSTGYPTYYRRALLLEWNRLPGFLPRNIMSLEQPTAESVQSLAAATPEKRFWLIKPGITPSESTRIEWIQARFPSAKLIPPVHTLPPGHQGIQPEPPMEMMLLELNE